MAYIANSYIVWHGEDNRDESDHLRGLEPDWNNRVELKPGDIIPKIVPIDIQQAWAGTRTRLDALGNPIFMATEDSTKEAPEKPEGPPRMELPRTRETARPRGPKIKLREGKGN